MTCNGMTLNQIKTTGMKELTQKNETNENDDVKLMKDRNKDGKKQWMNECMHACMHA